MLYQGKALSGDASLTIRLVFMEAIQETSEIFICADIGGKIFQFVR